MSHQELPIMNEESGNEAAADEVALPRSSPAQWPRVAKIALAIGLGVVALLGCAGMFQARHQQQELAIGASSEIVLEDELKLTGVWTQMGMVGVSERADKAGSDGMREWIIQCPDDWSDRLAKFGEGSPGKMMWKGDGAKGVSAIVYEGTKEQLGETLKQNGGALFAEEVVEVQAAGLLRGEGEGRRLEEQSVSSRLWGLDRLDDEDGLDRSYNNFGHTGAGVHVYVLDTGIRTTHQEFDNRAIPEFDVTVRPAQECNGDRNCARDRNGHGTHCAGTIAGKTYGVAKRAQVHAVKVLGDSGGGSTAGIVRAINYVTANGQRPAVISMSLGCGTPCSSRASAVAVERANRQGVTVVVAAGNNGRTSRPDACDYSPAGIPQAITVASTTSTDRRSSFSNTGRCVDIFAPGSDIFSASPDSDSATKTLSGTSMACPHVSGVAALLLSEEPALRPDQVASRLVASARTNKVSDARRDTPNKLLHMGTLDKGGDTTPPRVFFFEISEGTCARAGGFVITDKNTCERAAAELGWRGRGASGTRALNRPEGCYVFRGGRLFLGTNPRNRGKGAETSTRGNSRHPICGFRS